MWISRKRINEIEKDINFLSYRLFVLENPLKYESDMPIDSEKTILYGYAQRQYGLFGETVVNIYLIRDHKAGHDYIMNESDITKMLKDNKILNERKIANG
jgi:hypothetical protein